MISSEQLLGQLRDELLAETQQRPSPTRRIHALKQGILVTLVILFYGVAYLALGGIHLDGERPTRFMVLTTVGIAISAAAAIWGVTGNRRSMNGPALPWLVALVFGVPLLQLAWVILGNELYPHSQNACSGRAGNVCLDLSLTLGSIPLLLLALVRRHANAAHPTWAGAALGTAIGASVAILLHLSCECTGFTHVLRGHFLPVALLALAGAYAGRRLARFRSSASPR
jgi:hypothetical protein